MRLGYLKWDDWNIEHIAEHGVEPEEVESAYHARQVLMRRAGVTRYGLSCYHVYGQTEAGRYLFIVLDHTPDGSYVVTARNMTENEKRLFRKVRGRQ